MQVLFGKEKDNDLTIPLLRNNSSNALQALGNMNPSSQSSQPIGRINQSTALPQRLPPNKSILSSDPVNELTTPLLPKDSGSSVEGSGKVAHVARPTSRPPEAKIIKALNDFCATLSSNLQSSKALASAVTNTTNLLDKFGQDNLMAMKNNPLINKTDINVVKAIRSGTKVVQEQLRQGHPLEAGLVTGILLSVVHRHEDKANKQNTNAMALAAGCLTSLWAWSYSKASSTSINALAAVAITSYALFEYINLTLTEKTEVSQMELDMMKAIIDLDQDDLLKKEEAQVFKNGISFAQQANLPH